MKTTILFLILLLCCISVAIADNSWQRLDADLQKVRFFPQNQIVFCLGTNGCLLRSIDSGITWKQSFTSTTINELLSIDFADASTGVVVGSDGIIIRTTDKGRTWELVQSLTTNTLLTVQFISSTEGFAGGAKGTFLKTNDAGLTWEAMTFPYQFSITSLCMTSPQTGIIVGDSSSILKTIDGGLHWQTQPISNLTIGNFYFQNCIQSNNKTYIIGVNLTEQKGVFITSEDGIQFTASDIPISYDFAIVMDTLFIINLDGIYKASLKTLQFSWVPLGDSTYSISIGASPKNSLCFITTTIALAVGGRKFIFRTTDAMDTWNLLSYYPTGIINNIKFLNDTTGYLLCDNSNHIYRTTDGGATWLPERAVSTKFVNMYDIAFISPMIGYAVTNSSYNSIIKTTDSGETYIPTSTVDGGYRVMGTNPKIRFWGDSVGVIAGDNVVRLTNDGGSTWGLRFFNKSFSDCQFVNSSTILLTGSTLVITRDNGQTWDSTSFPFSGRLTGCWVIDSNNFVVVGSSQNDTKKGRIFRTSDGGKLWTVVDSSSALTFLSVRFSNKLLGYSLSGSIGELLQTKDGGNTWKSIAKKNMFSSSYFGKMEALESGNVIVSLSQPDGILRSSFDDKVLGIDKPTVEVLNVATVWLSFPRPIPSTGKLLLDALWVENLDVSSIHIKLYDMLGVELRDISDSFHPNSGTNTGIVEFEGGTLPIGIYYIEISGGGYRKAVPVIIAR